MRLRSFIDYNEMYGLSLSEGIQQLTAIVELMHKRVSIIDGVFNSDEHKNTVYLFNELTKTNFYFFECCLTSDTFSTMIFDINQHYDKSCNSKKLNETDVENTSQKKNSPV